MAILQCFSEVGDEYIFALGDIGNRAGNLDDFEVGACAEVEFCCCVVEELLAMSLSIIYFFTSAVDKILLLLLLLLYLLYCIDFAVSISAMAVLCCD